MVAIGQVDVLPTVSLTSQSIFNSHSAAAASRDAQLHAPTSTLTSTASANSVSTASTLRAGHDYCTVALPSCVFSVRASCSLVLHVAACCIYVALQYARFAVHGERVQTTTKASTGFAQV